MSGVGAPATTAPTCSAGALGARARRGCGGKPQRSHGPTPGGDDPTLYVWGWGPSYSGPEPVARARRGARNCAATPYAWRRRPRPRLYVRGWGPLCGPAYMSGVGAPATPAPGGDDPPSRGICLGLGPQLHGPAHTPGGDDPPWPAHMSGVGAPAIRPRTMAGG
eukprot:gene25615-biopygen4511